MRTVVSWQPLLAERGWKMQFLHRGGSSLARRGVVVAAKMHEALTLGPYVQGQLVRYSYLVTNTGHRTLHDIAVVDDRVARVTCRTTRLAPGQHTLCHGDYRITAQDLRSGHVTNLAQAGGIDARGDTFASHLVKVTIRVARFVPVTG